MTEEDSAIIDLIDEIRRAWGWAGIEPSELVMENAFGNIMVLDTSGRFWHLCPEELSCEVVAESAQRYAQLREDPEFIQNWSMRNLVEAAQAKCGPLSEEQRYCLKRPGVLGGAYDADNLATAPFIEMIRVSGDLAEQIKDVPDGEQIQVEIVRKPNP